MIADLPVTIVPIGDLIEHPDNPRRGNQAEVEASIRDHGFYGVITRQASTGYIIAGNTRKRAAAALGFDSLPVQDLPVDDIEAKRILLHDNRTSELGEFDAESLVNLLSELAFDEAGLVGTGYGDAELDDLLKSAGITATAATAFLDPALAGGDVPPEPDNSVTPPSSIDDRPPGDLVFTVAYTVTGEQRDAILAALRAARIHLGDTSTAADALAHICTQWALENA